MTTTSPDQTVTPDQTVLLFADYLTAGDLEGAVSLYDPTASFLPEPGKRW